MRTSGIRTVSLMKQFEGTVYSNKYLSRMSEEEESGFYKTLIEVSSDSFGADQTGFWKGKREEFDYLKTLTYFVFVHDLEDSRKVVGWTGIRIFKLSNQTACYLDSSGVVSKYQGNSVIPRANAFITREAFYKRPYYDFLMFSRTENPVIYKILISNLGEKNVYPRMDEVVHSKKHETSINAVIQYLKQEDMLDMNAHIIKNAYGYLDKLYGERPKCSNKKINEFFHSKLGPNDAFLLMGVLNLKNIIKAII